MEIDFTTGTLRPYAYLVMILMVSESISKRIFFHWLIGPSLLNFHEVAIVVSEMLFIVVTYFEQTRKDSRPILLKVIDSD